MSARSTEPGDESRGPDGVVATWSGSGNLPHPFQGRANFSVVTLQLLSSGELSLKPPRFLGLGATPLRAAPAQLRVITPCLAWNRAGLAITHREGLNWYFWQNSGWQYIFAELAGRGFPTEERIRKAPELWRPWSQPDQ